MAAATMIKPIICHTDEALAAFKEPYNPYWFVSTRPQQVKSPGFEVANPWAVGQAFGAVEWIFSVESDWKQFCNINRAYVLIAGLHRYGED